MQSWRKLESVHESIIHADRNLGVRGCGLFQMCRHYGEQLLIIDFPNVGVSPTRHIRNQLAEPPIWIAFGELTNRLEKGCSLGSHQTTSLILGSLVTSRLGSVWMISAGTNWPGNNLATRVARVTPSLIRKCPFFPQTSCNGGIPLIDAPCWAICRANLAGSAPCGRPGGTCSSAGSTIIRAGICRSEILLRTAFVRLTLPGANGKCSSRD